MPKRIPAHQLDDLVAIVTTRPEGASVGLIREALPYELPPRTLQRRLALLTAQGRLVAEGHGRGLRYRAPVEGPSAPAMQDIRGAGDLAAGPGTLEGRGEPYIPVSAEGEAIRRAVRAPLHHRRPVGYQRSFLDAYRPNVTFYLPADTRRRLLEAGRPPDGARPAGTYARTIYRRLLIDLSWNSSRLEGNTYSLLETERLLELGEAAEGKDALEAQMILNHKAAIDLLVEQADEIGFDRYTILNLHGLLADNLLADPQAAGRLRRIPVGIAGTTYHPLEVPQLIEECFQQVLDTASAISDPFEQAFFALVHLAYLQGFEDVNKRVARLAANIPLIRNNLCPVSFVDVPERTYIEGVLGVYELNRIELLRDVFVWACQRSSARYSTVRQSLGEPDPFRLRYRALIAAAVAAVVRGRLDKQAATALARQYAADQVPLVDRTRFIEVVETELMSLHEGNIARYRLRPADYETWRQSWR
ncbi:Fic family protein [Thioalkalivibrio sp. XN279]|uniref:Fic family protein n=1 Tax=Thioalkalivibrio sp. XN279 TaxID=2714953 RepID=UPI0014086E08|nr:Fic family protein [Thioalkalivibrio sp. XN279]NHA16066.1 Fic family protein [Thioalkalivibrio sp. XN279]